MQLHAGLCFRCQIWLEIGVCTYLGRPCRFIRQHVIMIILQMMMIMITVWLQPDVPRQALHPYWTASNDDDDDVEYCQQCLEQGTVT